MLREMLNENSAYMACGEGRAVDGAVEEASSQKVATGRGRGSWRRR